MKKIIIFTSLIISSLFAQPVFSEDLPMDQALLLNQLQTKLQNTSPKELEKATADPDLAALMEVMKMVQNKSYKEAIPVLENLLKKPEGKGLTTQSRTMIKNLIEVMKVMDSEYINGTMP